MIASTAGSGLTAQDVGGSVGDKQVELIVHGSRSQEMPLLYDEDGERCAVGVATWISLKKE